MKTVMSLESLHWAVPTLLRTNPRLFRFTRIRWKVWPSLQFLLLLANKLAQVMTHGTVLAIREVINTFTNLMGEATTEREKFNSVIEGDAKERLHE